MEVGYCRGPGPSRAVEPQMMMIIVQILHSRINTSALFGLKIWEKCIFVVIREFAI
jgi:hypothetical protein